MWEFFEKIFRKKSKGRDSLLESTKVLKEENKKTVNYETEDPNKNLQILGKPKITYLETKIEKIFVKERKKSTKLEFHLQNGRIFQKGFLKNSLELQNWIDKKKGDSVKLWVYPDGIIRNIS